MVVDGIDAALDQPAGDLRRQARLVRLYPVQRVDEAEAGGQNPDVAHVEGAKVRLQCQPHWPPVKAMRRPRFATLRGAACHEDGGVGEASHHFALWIVSTVVLMLVPLSLKEPTGRSLQALSHDQRGFGIRSSSKP